MRIFTMSVLLATALLATDHSYEISPMIGGVKPEGNLNIDDQFSYGLRFQMNDYNLLGLVPELSFDRTTDTDFADHGGDTAINRFGFNGLYDFKDFSDTLTPYLLVGLGYEDVEDEPANDYDSSAYGNWGGGVKWKIIEDIALRAEVKHLIRTDDGGNELYYGIGLSIPFGAKASESHEDAKPAESNEATQASEPKENAKTETAAAVAVVAPVAVIDSDGDGVIDANDKCPNTPKGAKVDENGCELDTDGDGVVDSKDKCPNTVKGEAVDENGCAKRIVLDIKFGNGSTDIDEKHSPKLQSYADFMKTNTMYTVTLVGYTDSVGSEKSNQKLSEKRAQSVKADLVKRGVDSSRVNAKGLGEKNPIADNKTAEGRAENRRIEAELKLTK